MHFKIKSDSELRFSLINLVSKKCIHLIELELNPEKKLKTKIVRVISRLIAKHG